MAPTEEMLGVHVGLKKYIWAHVNLQERGPGEVEPKSTVEMFGIHVEFTGDIS